MSSPRLYGSKPAPARNGYLSDLLHTIDDYIADRRQVSTASHGILRAGTLKVKVVNELDKVEGLSELQLQWRMYDYVYMEQGAGPLATSKVLRAAIQMGLCRQLNITNKLLQETKKRIQDEHLQMNAKCVLPQVFYRQDEKAICKKAVQTLIRERLLQKAEQSIDRIENKFFEMLRPALQKCHADKLMAHIENQWLAVEKLNDLQLMCRLYEAVMISMQVSNGLLGDNEKLRWSIAHALCNFMCMDEALIRREEFKVLEQPVYLASPFGSIYQHHDPGRISLSVRMEYVAKGLHCRAAKGEYVSAPFSEGAEVEMQKIGCKKF